MSIMILPSSIYIKTSIVIDQCLKNFKSNLKAERNYVYIMSLKRSKLKWSFTMFFLPLFLIFQRSVVFANAQTCNEVLTDRFEFDQNLFTELNMQVILKRVWLSILPYGHKTDVNMWLYTFRGHIWTQNLH